MLEDLRMPHLAQFGHSLKKNQSEMRWYNQQIFREICLLMVVSWRLEW